jgi:hypothetical protein
VGPFNLLGCEPGDGVTADAVGSGHVEAIRAWPGLAVKSVDRKHLSLANRVHDRNAGCEPSGLLFRVDGVVLIGVPFVSGPAIFK